MNIWIFNHHALTPDMSGGTRHYDFAKELVKRGHSVTIFASSFHYAKHEEMKKYDDAYFLEEIYDGVKFVWIQTRPYQGNGLGRVLNMLDYMIKVQKIALTCKEKADVIIGSSVHLFAVYAAYKISKKLHIPFVMEVRDIWPQTLIDMGVSKWHPFVLLLAVLEKFLYKKADKIITNLPYAYKHIETFGVKREDIIWISNGVDTSPFKALHVKHSEKFILTYTGSMGQANALETLLEVAKRLDKKLPIYFRLIGDGVLKASFKKYILENALNNVSIEDAVPKEEIAHILMSSSVLYVGLKNSPLYRFGISLNKIYDYLAANRTIIFASDAPNNPVKDAQAGVSIEPENVTALEKAIVTLYKMGENERTLRYGNGLNYVEKNFSIQSLTDKLENLLNGLVCKKK